MKKIICVLGPTASGKTELGARIALAVGGEVVSADSMQIYSGAHIASAAADKEEMLGVKHHLLEFLPYDAKFTVYDYLAAAREVIADIHSREKTPVIVGGTGLYINALLDGIRLSPDTTYQGIREYLEKQYEVKGGEYMLSRLKKIDPETAEKLSVADKKRIVRALEIFELTNKTKSSLDALSKQSGKDYDYTAIGITFKDREKLYERINARVESMLQKGLLNEAKTAFDRAENDNYGLTQAIGHKEFFPYFKGEMTYEDAVENLKRQTRRYAKRQLTWFRRREDINWIYADCEDLFSSAAKILESEGYRLEKQ